MRKLILVDVCGTLTKVNTTETYIYNIVQKSFKNRVKFWYYSIFNNLFVNFHFVFPFRQRIIGLLAGYTSQELSLYANTYIATLLKHDLIYSDIAGLIERYSNKTDYDVVLLSAAIEPVIKVIAEHFGIKYFCTKLELIGGVYTGKITRDLLNNKHEEIKQFKLDNKYESIEFYTNNIEDLVAISIVSKMYFFPNSEKELQKQIKKNARFANLEINKRNIVKRVNPDINSVTKANYLWTYLPSLYYFQSRIRLRGLLELISFNFIPILIILIVFNSFTLSNILILTVSQIIFYSVYEIGGLVNDAYTKLENIKMHTQRVAPGVKYNLYLFIFIRICFFLASSICLYFVTSNVFVFVVLNIAVLLIYLAHSYVKFPLRLITFVLLKVFRNLNVIILLSCSQLLIMFYLLFSLDVPKRLVIYCSQKLFKREIKIPEIYYLLGYGLVCILSVLMTNNYQIMILPPYLALIVIGKKTVAQLLQLKQTYSNFN